jgi:thiamine-monophosphate kinase
MALSAETQIPLTRIGTIVGASEGLVIVDENGDPLPALPRAFDHFA